jgi:hypothetical protein
MASSFRPRRVRSDCRSRARLSLPNWRNFLEADLWPGITSGLPVIHSQPPVDDAGLQSNLRWIFKDFDVRDGTIIEEWHRQTKMPSRLGRRKTLRRFLCWPGPLVPTGLLNSSLGVG